MDRIGSRPSSCSTAISIVAAALLALGVVMVFSASASLTSPSIAEHPLERSAVRQAGYTTLGLVTLLAVGLCPYEFWRIRRSRWFQPAALLLFLTLCLLVLVLVPGIGERRNGARRWLSLGPAGVGLSFQPSEVAKLAVVVFLAAAACRMGGRIRAFWTGLLPLLGLLAVVAGLVGVEDFGTGALIFIVGAAMLVAAGARLWHLGLSALPAVAMMAWLVISRPYRVERVMAFLNPDADPQGAGYHQMQSLITIASGGWWGRGLGAGIQKYGYLPEGRSDFVFAVICEEMGIIGGALVIALFVTLLWQGRKAVAAAPCEFGRLLALGATLTIGFQAAMNMAVVTVSVPTKGIALPFVSAGGTSAVIFSVLVGMLVNVARTRGAPAEDASRVPARAASARYSPAAIPGGAVAYPT